MNNQGWKGGAIKIDCSTFDCNSTIQNSVFKNNQAIEGGAIQFLKKKPVLSNNTFMNNTASYGKDISSYPVRLKLSDESI